MKKIIVSLFLTITAGVVGIKIHKKPKVEQRPEEKPLVELTKTVQAAESETKATSTPATTAATRGEIIEYTVKPGDTISTIAAQFSISSNTILWANNLTAKSLIKPGAKLTILPVSGVLYTVKSGDTISSIASKFNADADKIASVNGIDKNASLKIGQSLIIPGGSKQAAATPTPKTSTSKATPKKPSTTSTSSGGVVWTSSALRELNRIPSAIRPSVRTKITNYAKSHGIKTITAEVYNSIRI